MSAPCAATVARTLESRRFGRLEIVSERVLTFPEGILGFEEFHEYLLVAPEALAPLSFLVALDDAEVAFPVLPAALCLADYAPELPADAPASVQAASREELGLLAICSVAADTHTLHANLRAPVIVNADARLARQVALSDSRYSLRHLLGAG